MKNTPAKSPIGLRIPEDLREYLKEKAAQNKRSLNSELWIRLEDSRKKEEANDERQAA